MSFAQAESGPLRAQTGPFGIMRQPIEAVRRAKLWRKTPEVGAVRKRMEF